LILAPELLVKSYDLLREFRQFKSLPPAEEVEFRVFRHPGKFADFGFQGVAVIRISEKTNGSLDTLLRSMAHEMVHFSLFVKGEKTWDKHGAQFHRMARSVCKTMGWDAKAF
jgi:hypothetical protein